LPGSGRLDLETAARTARQVTEAIRDACIDAAIDGYEQAAIRGLCHDGAWEAAVSAIRMVPLDALAEPVVQAVSESRADATAGDETLQDATLRLAKRFASPGGPASGSAAAVTGAVAAGLLEWTAALSTLRGPEAFRKRARSIAGRALALQSSLSAAAQADAELVERWVRAPRDGREDDPDPPTSEAATDAVLAIAKRCAQVATLAGEVARDGAAAVRPDAAAALQLAASATECALALAEENLRRIADTDRARSTTRRIRRIRLLAHRVQPVVEDRGSV
jgi:formiminotetrahydrofolate cyclodeaminase